MRLPGSLEVRIRDLHKEHGFLVLNVLAKAGVPPSDVEDAAQEVWITVCTKLASGQPEPDSWPAFLTVLARGRAANHRRAASHRRTLPLEAPPTTVARALSAEQILILVGLIEAIPNADQREAALLRAKGYSIKEIAAAQGITEAGVRKRLEMAGQQMEKESRRGEHGEKAGTFWGFGSFEKLLDALSEERERQWKGIEAVIEQLEPPPESPSPARPPATAPAIPPVPRGASGLAAAAKSALAAAFAGALLAGALLGAWGSSARVEAAPLLAFPEPPTVAGTSVPIAAQAPSPAAPTPRDTAPARPIAGAPPARAPAHATPRRTGPDDLRGLLRRARERRAAAAP